MELLTSFEGRTGRKGFWMGLLAVIGISLVSGWVALTLGAESVVAMAAKILLGLLALYVYAAVLAKRLHDRGKPALPWAAIFLAPGTVMMVLQIFQVGFVETEVMGQVVAVPGQAFLVTSYVSLAVGMWMVIEMGFLKGQPTANRFGPPVGAAPAAAEVA